MPEILVIGAGLAGSILAKELLKENLSVAIISNPALPTSSSVAGGLINPVTGKYLAKTWLADQLFNELHTYYQNLELDLSASFFHTTGLYRPFTSPEHKETSLKQIEKHELSAYIEVVEEVPNISTYFNNPLGGMLSKNAGWLDLPFMLTKLHGFLKARVQWIEEMFDHSAIQFYGEGGVYKNISFKKIIFCEGFYVKDNPLFNWLPFNPVKGETLMGKIEGYHLNHIVNQGKWIIPLGNEKVRLGATYSWHSLDFNTTDEARDQLLEVAGRILKSKFEITGQQAGVRPATKDRRPILGLHPSYTSAYIFNGLGTKGVSLAPYFAKQLVRNLFHGELINPEANIERFYPLYS